MCSLSKEQSILSRETIQNAFFQNCTHFSTWTFYPLSSIAQTSFDTRMRCSYLTFPAVHDQSFILQRVWSMIRLLMWTCDLEIAGSIPLRGRTYFQAMCGLSLLAPPGWFSGERVGLMTWWL